ncbi:MAG: protein translocase subunit SecD [Hyphomicrobiales bacterium]
MLHFSRWKIIAILATVVLSALLALPNILPPEWQKKVGEYTIARPMTLGLDLQGGSNVLLEVDRKDFINTLLTQQLADIRTALREGRIAFRLNRTPDGAVVQITKPEELDKAEGILRNLRQPVDTGFLGAGASANLFDLNRNGQQFTFTISQVGLDAKIARAIKQSLRIIENRINSSGVTEPTIQQQGKDRIVVQMPGIGNPDEVVKLLGQTAKLTFQLVCETQPSGPNQQPPPDCAAYPMKDEPNQIMWVQTSSAATVDGADLSDAQPSFGQNNQPIVSFKFNQRGALRFGKLTADNVGKPFAILLDGVVQSAPRINEPILGGSGQISGNFTVEETTNLAIVLRSGALPAKLVPVEQRTVGPSLGADSIRAGFTASLIGLVLVLAFMVFAYGIFGIFANIALLANLLMLIAIMSVVGFTLTLPGIAGIVLTMGVAVDSNVLIYERIREEWRNGRTALNSIDSGFKFALATILDSNITSFIAAVVLFGVGSGPVRGFAVTHAIGILTTMFTAFTLTRLIVAFWVRQSRPKEIPL